jgi:2-iminobutanoate/2-iminopropanoate deaminase
MENQLTKPLAKYVHTRVCGSLVFVAGQGCRDPKTNAYAGITRHQDGTVESYDITAQAKGVLNNIELALKSLDLNRKNIMDVTVFLCDMVDFPKMNDVWNEFFSECPVAPTRTTVCVKKLPGDNFVEMKAIATRDQIV